MDAFEGHARARRAHNERQRQSFDRLAQSFLQPIPADVEQRTRRIVEEACLPPGSAVLDVGTGTGVLLPYIAQTRPRRVVACDLSAEMLRLARQRISAAVTFVQSDVADLPPTLGPFDAVFCNACFANFFDPRGALRAIAALLAPSGRVIISHPLGRRFVSQLRQQSPELDLRALPAPDDVEGLLSGAAMRLELLRDEPDFYLLIGRR